MRPLRIATTSQGVKRPVTEYRDKADLRATVSGLLTFGATVAMIVLGASFVIETMCWTAGWRTI
jgi:hypothetical protein